MSNFLSSCLPKDAPFQSYDDVIRHLNGLGVFHMDMGLGRMERALSALKLDQLNRPSVQIVGTNGKGSTSSFLQSLAMAHGLRTGLYTSPHFVRPEERIRVDDTLLPPSRWPGLASNAVLAEPDLTYFELLTVMAAESFELSSCDLVIYEAGLGGRYDATSALPAHMTCFVPIGLDHVEVLGDSIAAIADDKSDAMRGRSLAVSAPQSEAARRVLESKAQALGVPLCAAPSPFSCEGTPDGRKLWDSLPPELRELAILDNVFPPHAFLGLNGPHQRVNAQTALLAWILLCHRFGWTPSRSSIRHGLEQAFIPGRLQLVPASGSRPSMWLDGAHNAHGMSTLVDAMNTTPSALRPGAAVFSCLKDKSPQRLAAMLREAVGDVPIYVPAIENNPRAAQKEELVSLLGQPARTADSLAEAIERAKEAAGKRPVLICGSLYLLGEVFARWPELLERP